MSTNTDTVVIEFVPFIIGIVLYNLTCLLLQQIVKTIRPEFYSYLQADQSKRFKPYFAFLLAWIITATSTPICMAAMASSDPAAAKFHASVPPNILEQICIGSRMVLWVGELPRLEFSSHYLMHHTWSLSAFLGIIWMKAPRLQLCAVIASLVTELSSTMNVALRLHGLTPRNSTLVFISVRVHTILLATVRIPAVLWCAALVLRSGGPGPKVLANNIGWLYYSLYLVYLFIKQAKMIGIVDFVGERPVFVRFFQRYHISVYGLIVGLAVVLSQVSTMLIYSKIGGHPLELRDAEDMSSFGLKMCVAGILGAYAIPLLLQTVGDGFRPDIPNHVEGVSKPVADPPRMAACEEVTISNDSLPLATRSTGGSLWIQAGLLSSAVTAAVLGQNCSFQKHDLWAAIAISLPLGEAVGRIACFFGGCCGAASHTEKTSAVINASAPIHKRQVIPAQLISSGLNFTAYITSLTTLALGRSTLFETALLAVTANGTIRLLFNSMRGDLAWMSLSIGPIGVRLSITSIIAAMQSLSAITWFTIFKPNELVAIVSDFVDDPHRIISPTATLALYAMLSLPLLLLLGAISWQWAKIKLVSDHTNHIIFRYVRKFVLTISSPIIWLCFLGSLLGIFIYLEGAKPPALDDSPDYLYVTESLTRLLSLKVVAFLLASFVVPSLYLLGARAVKSSDNIWKPNFVR